MKTIPRIGLVGYGKMGKMIHQLSQYPVTVILARGFAMNEESVADCDVLIEFTNRKSAPHIIEKAILLNKPIVSGTTGFDVMPLQILAEEVGSPFFYSANFSMGIFCFNKLLEMAAKLFCDYDVAGHEVHHTAKKDSPSGTAKMLAKAFLDKRLEFSSSRIGHVVGIHTIMLDSPFDTIELIHRAKNREGYAQGALTAAQWLIGKKGFHTMEDLIDDIHSAHHTFH